MSTPTPSDEAVRSAYVWVKHPNGSVSRILKPAGYLACQSEDSGVLPGQCYVAYVFEPSIQARADPHAIYGLINVIGTFASEEQATQHVRGLLKQNAEREDEYMIARCGHFVALSTAPAALASTDIVDIEQTMHESYGAAMDKRKQHELIETTKRSERLQKEAERIRHAKQAASAKQAEEGTDLLSYTKLRASRASQLCAAARLRRTAVQAGEKAATMEKRASELSAKMRTMDPAFAQGYLDLYTTELAKVGSEVKRDDVECDANYLALSDEEPPPVDVVVKSKIQKRGMTQAHEVDDDS
jgi:hypothetical protein